MPPADRRSKLFHAIVMAGAAFGSACGGSVRVQDGSPDATSDGQSGESGAGGDEAAADAVAVGDAVVDASESDAAPDASPGDGATEGGDAADAGAPDGNPCALPGSTGHSCGAPQPYHCCIGGGCFPCFV